MENSVSFSCQKAAAGSEGASARTEEGVEHHTDFFGEPVAFLTSARPVASSPSLRKSQSIGQIVDALSSLDTFILAVVTRGKSADGGGDDEGIPAQAAHSSAIAWSELLRHARHWNADSGLCAAPMLAVAAAAPLLAQAGSRYVCHLDTLLSRTSDQIRLVPLAMAAVRRKYDPNLSPRERYHLHAMHHLLHNEHSKAMAIYSKLLEASPGDALALSLAIDVAFTTGDRAAALRVAGSVAAYWAERGRHGITMRPSIPGHSIGSSLISVGFAAGGRHADAERLADRSLRQDKEGSGGIASWALAIAFDSEGRTSEGISLLSGFDGVQNYEKCGFLFFDSRLHGYGARFAVDREGTGEGGSSIRMYDTSFERVLHYSGYARSGTQRGDLQGLRQVPQSRKRRMVEKAGESATTVFQKLFGLGPSKGDTIDAIQTKQRNAYPNGDKSMSQKSKAEPTVPITTEDILAWLPPTPQLLTDATMLLLRLTLKGSVSESDDRWRDLRSAWVTLIEQQNVCSICDGGEGTNFLSKPLVEFFPLASIASALLVEPSMHTESRTINGVQRELCKGLRLMGKLMRLCDSDVMIGPASDDRDTHHNETRKRQQDDGITDGWRLVVQHLAKAREGGVSFVGLDEAPSCNNEPDSQFILCKKDFDGWAIDVRPVVEHCICHAAVLSEDYESLCLARSVCSESVSLRPNSPENWWRYSVILRALGDEVAAEDAQSASVSLGFGEGGMGGAN